MNSGLRKHFLIIFLKQEVSVIVACVSGDPVAFEVPTEVTGQFCLRGNHAV
jgi:hypothetical protein